MLGNVAFDWITGLTPLDQYPTRLLAQTDVAPAILDDWVIALVATAPPSTPIRSGDRLTLVAPPLRKGRLPNVLDSGEALNAVRAGPAIQRVRVTVLRAKQAGTGLL
jgi:hypothetical protein